MGLGALSHNTHTRTMPARWLRVGGGGVHMNMAERVSGMPTCLIDECIVSHIRMSQSCYTPMHQGAAILSFKKNTGLTNHFHPNDKLHMGCFESFQSDVSRDCQEHHSLSP